MTEHEKFKIHIDGEPFEVEQRSLNGAQLKALVGRDSSYQLFEELPGNHPDRLIGDTESVAIKNGLQFYTVPPATFGGTWV